jgi:hypothetical protein
MAYTFRGDFRFELAKACITEQRNPAPPGRPSLSEAANYAAQFPSLVYSKFRSKQGGPIPIESAPLCSHQPEQISLLALRGKFRRSYLKAKPKPAPSNEPVAGAAPAAAVPDDDPLPSKRRRLVPALLSMTLAVLVAVTVGLAIGHSNAFRMKSPQIALDTSAAPIAAPALPAAAAANASAPPEQVVLTPSLSSKLQDSMSAPLPEPKAALRRPPKHLKHAKKKHAKPRPAPEPAPPAEPFDDGSSLSVQAAPKKLPIHHSLRTDLAKCQRYSLIGRERCKWRVCNHKWGKDGCPAYVQPSNQAIMGMGIAYAPLEIQSAASSPHN